MHSGPMSLPGPSLSRVGGTNQPWTGAGTRGGVTSRRVAGWLRLLHSQTCFPFTRRSLSPNGTGTARRTSSGLAYQNCTTWVPVSSDAGDNAEAPDDMPPTSGSAGRPRLAVSVMTPDAAGGMLACRRPAISWAAERCGSTGPEAVASIVPPMTAPTTRTVPIDAHPSRLLTRRNRLIAHLPGSCPGRYRCPAYLARPNDVGGTFTTLGGGGWHFHHPGR